MELEEIPSIYENKSVIELDESNQLYNGLPYSSSNSYLNYIVNTSSIEYKIESRYIGEVRIVLMECINEPTLLSSILDALFPFYQEQNAVFTRQKIVNEFRSILDKKGMDLKTISNTLGIYILLLEQQENNDLSPIELYMPDTDKLHKMIILCNKGNDVFGTVGSFERKNIQTLFNIPISTHIKTDFKEKSFENFLYDYIYF